MLKKDSIQILKKLDGLRRVGFDRCQCFLHDKHRWVLPLIHDAQQNGILSAPCTLISFDAHHDTKQPVPDCMTEIKRIRGSGLSIGNLVFLCEEKLSLNNDDWIRAGMELGLISDVVVFGVQYHLDSRIPPQFADHTGGTHRIEICPLPREALERSGPLGACHNHRQPKELWSILDWVYMPQKGFSFGQRPERVLLDFDLDCFKLTWATKYTFPWPDEVFQTEFLTDSRYYSTEGWSGKAFVKGLMDRAGLIAIAREQRCCGGEQKADEVLRKLNHFIFDDKLCLKWKCTKCGDIYEGLEAGDCAACAHPASHYELLSDDQ